ncbi:MAG: hypothetical protein AAF637_19935, partial [Pseudomonadota bacterium]
MAHNPKATTRSSAPKSSVLDRFALGVSLVAALFLAFLGGALVMLAKVFPFSYLEQAYQGGTALIAKETEYLDPYRTDFWKPVRTAASGVTRHEPARAQDGLTLYTSGDEARAA